ncbi:hypothetical protein [Ancylomarina longa]|uniref:Uncharacterized protein n=1 Tax=Ancylomarina longa TaxID=2487017 RepID=A0A434AFI7_9BACT|nr:hypothetical protein [Ancylomarina longa]RUT73146.1 hypothetical protein DLK05_14785 [Ancylomarina longa]
MKIFLLFALLLVGAKWCFGQEIISKKDKLSKIEVAKYTIVYFKDGGNGRSEVTVDVGDGLEWKFYDKTARKLRRIFISQTDLLNYMFNKGWELKEMVSLKPQNQSFIFRKIE